MGIMSEMAQIGGRQPIPVKVEEGKSYWWCACGLSKAQPFCDGSHKKTTKFVPMEFKPTASKPLVDLGAKSAASIGKVSNLSRAVFTMLTDDAVMDVVGRPGGLRETLPTGGIHVCAGTHSVAAVASLQKLHKFAGQILIAAPVLGRPDVVASGNATIAAIGEMDWDRLAGLADFDWHAVVLDQELDLLGEIGTEKVRPRHGGLVHARPCDETVGEA